MRNRGTSSKAPRAPQERKVHMTPFQVTARVGDKDIILETGKVAKQAHGSIWARMGESIVLITVVSAAEKKEGIDFFPLTVDYQEKLYAAGRIPGSYFKREGRLTERETLTSRIIDRSCRPLFPEGYANETQIIATVVSFDQENDPDVLALTGASAALQCSDVPFHGPFAGVRVGRLNGQFVANPTLAQRAECDLDVIMAASRDAITMVEGGAREITESVMIDALLFGHAAVQPLLDAQLQLHKASGHKQKKAFEAPKSDEALKVKIKALTWDKVKEAYGRHDKHDRYGRLSEIKKELLTALKEEAAGDAARLASIAIREKEIKGYYEDVKYEYMRKMITDEGKRIGGRGMADIRQIWCEVGLLPRVHGSALFTRGETQALVGATLGTADRRPAHRGPDGHDLQAVHAPLQLPALLGGRGQVPARPRPPRDRPRRLAERALKAVLPRGRQLPYVIRLVSDILESNGSSSMASVCGGCLALMDAGVPIKAPVAGIAMGLIKEGEKIAILSDILGDEDHLGDMDFKVCGTDAGITSIQMDIKIGGVTREILEKALDQAAAGRKHILAEMAKVAAGARAATSASTRRASPPSRSGPSSSRTSSGPAARSSRTSPPAPAARSTSRTTAHIAIASSDPAQGRGRHQDDQEPHRRGRGRQDLHRHGPQDRRVRRLRGDLPGHRRPGPHLRALRQARQGGLRRAGRGRRGDGQGHLGRPRRQDPALPQGGAGRGGRQGPGGSGRRGPKA